METVLCEREEGALSGRVKLSVIEKELLFEKKVPYQGEGAALLEDSSL